jgi:hypothetical protein
MKKGSQAPMYNGLKFMVSLWEGKCTSESELHTAKQARAFR